MGRLRRQEDLLDEEVVVVALQTPDGADPADLPLDEID